MNPENPQAVAETVTVDRDRLLDQVITDYLKALQAGETAEPAAWCRRYPELAAELSAFFADRARIERLAEPLRAAAPPAGPVVRYFGDYELLEEIARGGMGIVYKARQVSLNRAVALKMILAGQLAAQADVERFRREAEAAGNLDHPNIVPIYEVGEYQGMQYFSMKFIEGGRLAVDRTSTRAELRSAAKQIGTVARAPFITPTAAASCTAISSPPTSSWTRRANRTSPTSAWPNVSPASRERQRPET